MLGLRFKTLGLQRNQSSTAETSHRPCLVADTSNVSSVFIARGYLRSNAQYRHPFRLLPWFRDATFFSDTSGMVCVHVEVSLMRQYRNRFCSNADHTKRIRKWCDVTKSDSCAPKRTGRIPYGYSLVCKCLACNGAHSNCKTGELTHCWDFHQALRISVPSLGCLEITYLCNRTTPWDSLIYIYICNFGDSDWRQVEGWTVLLAEGVEVNALAHVADALWSVHILYKTPICGESTIQNNPLSLWEIFYLLGINNAK